ncbi:hypothetical protein [Singulisphaera acidiphila]|uniref:Uncharacterized protein n=1 Tax=Singulisphaera acidiphila (strain ATCC BAA-1392 / DSM 18658 / VKM B-2454 / MOB10) TaxID=886293 RepID=L0DQ31_SINAD|nr:hypothetical protein [Singulisphaera acidiphila]AGA30953.1 hypothetical protein Sinac_6893 [Singulisphaera acidiphila DSM 18658]
MPRFVLISLVMLIGCHSAQEPEQPRVPVPNADAALVIEERLDRKEVITSELAIAQQPPQSEAPPDPSELQKSLTESTALALAADESPPTIEPDQATRAKAQQMVSDAVKDVAGAIARLEQLIDRRPHKFMLKHREYLKSLVAAKIQAAEEERAERAREQQAKIATERARLAAQAEEARLERDRLQQEQLERDRLEQARESESSMATRSSSGMSSSSSSGICGAPTKKGGSCQRRVAGGGYCYQHR